MLEKKQNFFTHLNSLWNRMCVKKINGSEKKTWEQNFVFVIKINPPKKVKPKKLNNKEEI